MINPLYRSQFVDSQWVSATVSTILKNGYVVLSDFLTPEAFLELKQSAEGKGNKKTGVLKDSFAFELAHAPVFFEMFQAIYKERCRQEGKEYIPLSEARQRIGFPYKDARDGKKTEETDYHYDGAYVNTTLAITMPPTGGELIAFPNLRISQNSIVAYCLSRMLRYIPLSRRLFPHIVVRSKPNDLCLFFGDRTFHGVEPIEVGERLILTINNHW